MKEKSDVARGWLLKAQSDLTALEASIQAGVPDMACFHAQQAAEKLLKAFLTSRELDFPFTHNLSKLAHRCAEVDVAFLALVPIMEPLTPYAVDSRYDMNFWPTREIALEAQNAAQSVRDFVLARLPTNLAGGPK